MSTQIVSNVELCWMDAPPREILNASEVGNLAVFGISENKTDIIEEFLFKHRSYR